MKKQDFTAFINTVATATDNDPIWYAGFLFLQLTEKQAAKTYDVLYNRYGENGKVKLPSGLVINK